MSERAREGIRAVSQGRDGVPRTVAAKLAEYAPRIPLTPRETVDDRTEAVTTARRRGFIRLE
jgi:hypothetical protein